MNCKEVARLVSESHDRHLSFFERLNVRMHLAMCVMCRKFSKQISIVRNLARRIGGSEADSPVAGDMLEASLGAEAKSRIKKMLLSGPER